MVPLALSLKPQFFFVIVITIDGWSSKYWASIYGPLWERKYSICLLQQTIFLGIRTEYMRIEFLSNNQKCSSPLHGELDHFYSGL